MTISLYGPKDYRASWPISMYLNIHREVPQIILCQIKYIIVYYHYYYLVTKPRVVSCAVVSCAVVSCAVVSCAVVSCAVGSCAVVSCAVVSCAVVWQVNLKTIKKVLLMPPELLTVTRSSMVSYSQSRGQAW